jgi:hypothetical protein
MADYKVTDTELTSIANAIRTKGGTQAQLEFPTGFVSAVQAIPTGGGGVIQPLSVSQNGTYTPPSGVDGYAPVTVSVPGGSGNVIQGTTAPTSDIGENGNYYYEGAYTNSERGYTSDFPSSTSQTKAGWEFTPNGDITLIGLSGVLRNSGTGSLILADVTGNIIKQIDNVSFTANVETEALFDTPLQLISGNNYIVQIWGSGLSYRQSNKTFNPKITYVQGRYGNLPGNTESGSVYSANILIGYEIVFIAEHQYHKENGMWRQLA